MIDVVKRLSDRSYQEKSWFGSGKSVSSPEELLCELFDDFMLDDFLNCSKDSSNGGEYFLGRKLVREVDSFSRTFGDFLNPKDVLDAPEWQKVRTAAQNFLESLERDKIYGNSHE